MTELVNLFSPIQIGDLSIRNRILVSAHTTMLGENGLFSDRHVRYYEARAKGGAGLIVTEAAGISAESELVPGMIQGWRDEIVPQFKKISDVVHAHGGKILAQAWHNGYQACSFYSLQPTRGVSPHPSPVLGEVPEELDEDGIKEIIQKYVDYALRVKEGAYDGVELHFGHGYLPQQFLSPFSNTRKDRYGGSLENRMRFGLELIQAVRVAVGDSLVVGIRISGDEMTPFGYTLDDMKKIAPYWEETGLVDYLSVSVGTYVSVSTATPPMGYPPKPFAYLATELKQVVDLPVFAAGRIIDPELADEMIKNHEADMVVMTRATVCDPEMPNKARRGRMDDIRRCIDCNEGCFERVGKSQSITCMQNPLTGREGILDLHPADQPLKVMVVGGGCAGMKAAAVAKQRGHNVSLYEKSEEPGGAVLIHSKVPAREEMNQVVRFMKHELEQLKVPVYLNTEVTPSVVLKENPDAVIIATGATTIENPSADVVGPYSAIEISEGARVVTAEDVLLGNAETGERVVVGDFQQYFKGILAAEILASQGKNVTLIMPMPTLLNAAPYLAEGCNLLFAFQRLNSLNVQLMPGFIVKAAKLGKVSIRNLTTEQDQELEADTLVTAYWRQANTDLYDELKGKIEKIFKIGDCLTPHRLITAIYQGYKTAMYL